MTNKELMLQGESYYADDKELLNERTYAKDICCKFNASMHSDYDQNMTMLQELLQTTRDDFYLTAPFYCDYGYNIKIGQQFYCNHNTVMLDGAPITFGDRVFIGPNCSFSTATHPLDYKTRAQGLEQALPISVGDDVWFGSNVVVVQGITIGSRVVIGAGSVVTRDIPDDVIAFGNPCRVQRENK